MLSLYEYENLSLTVADHSREETTLGGEHTTQCLCRLMSDASLTRLNRAVMSGRIIPYLIAVMFMVGAAGTAAVEILSPNSFQSLGDAAWWAATTVTTIGYGDVVPGTSGGRFIAVFVMFASVATVSFTTAVVTASFVAFQQRRLGPRPSATRSSSIPWRAIETRLDAIEQKLG